MSCWGLHLFQPQSPTSLNVSKMTNCTCWPKAVDVETKEVRPFKKDEQYNAFMVHQEKFIVNINEIIEVFTV